jgi:O-antigen/teichoic acid export membrane protein
MSGLRRSIFYAFLERYGVYAIGLGGTMIVARVMSPADFGVFAIGAAIVTLIEVLREFGAATYLVQAAELPRSAVRAAMSVSLVLSLLCGAIILAAAEPIARFYAEPGMATVLAVLAGTFLTTPLALAPLAMLRREMAFERIAAVGLLSAVTQVLLTVALALLGFGYMALAWGVLAQGLVRAAAAHAVRPMPWALLPTLSGWQPILGFGGWSSATAVVNVLHESLPQLILGRTLGAVPVGLLGRAQVVCRLPDKLVVSALNPVILPALAEHARNGGSLREPYLLGLRFMAGVQWPALVCLGLLADPLVRLLLGPQWSEVPHLVRILVVGMLPLVPAFLTYPVLVALGRIRDTLTVSLIGIPPSILILTLASFHSLEAVAAAGWITSPLQVWIALHFIRRRIPMSWAEIGGAVLPGAIAAGGATLGPLAAMALHGLTLDLPVSSLLVAVPVAVAGWLAGLWLGGHPLLPEISRAGATLGRRLGRSA